MARKQPIIRYGISLGIDTTDMARGAREANKVTRRLNRDIGKAEAANRQYKHALDQLKVSLKEGAITKKEYNAQLTRELERRNRLNGVTRARKIQMQREAEAQRKLNKQKREEERQSKRLEAQLTRENAVRAKRAQMMGGGMAGGFSAMGMGGPAAGAARFAGNFGAMSGLGLAATGAIGIGGAGMMGTYNVIKKSIGAYAELESKLVDLKVLFGEEKGDSLGRQFKALAKNTALTTSQLVSNAKTWASYGLTAEDITKRLERLGTVAGGNTEKFKALTIAFAQVNAQGKLMGQEKNQLINAGFSLSEVAKVAGVEMTEFAKAMEDGRITAEHVNQALVNMTEEGGLFAGLLEEKAKTLEGQATILKSKWEEAYQSMGGQSSYLARYWNQASAALADYVKDFSDWSASTHRNNGEFGDVHNIHGAGSSAGFGGSYSMSGAYLDPGMGGGLTVGRAGDRTLTSHDEMIKIGLRLDRKMELLRGRTPGFMMRPASADRYAELYDEQVKLYGEDFQMTERQKSAAEKKKIKEEAEAKAEAEAKLAEKQAGYSKRYREGFMFQDPTQGGANKYAYQREQYQLKQDYEAGNLAKKDYEDILKLQTEDHERRLEIDRKLKAKEQEDYMKRMSEELMGGGSKYSGKGYTKETIGVLEARDKNAEKIEELSKRKMAQGFSGGLAGGGAEYKMIADLRSQAQDRALAAKHRKKIESLQARNNELTRQNLMELKKQGKLVEDPDKSGAV